MRSSSRSQYSMLAVLAAVIAAPALAQVQHGSINIVEINGENEPNSITMTRADGGAGSWVPFSNDDDESNRGDYHVDFLTGNDIYNGILIVGPYENGRVEDSMGEDPYYATLSHARSTSSNTYWVAVHDSPSGSECNYNPALAYFPIADGWWTGAAYNSENGGVIDEFVGHSDIILTNTFDDPGTVSAFIDADTGNFGVRLEGIDMRRDGVLLACGAKNEDNYTAVYCDYDGTALLNNRDNGDNGEGSEQDPTAFVFVTEGTPGVTMGRVTGSGRILFQQGDFEVELYGVPDTAGTYRLTIPDEGTDTGTLLVSPCTEYSGNNVDNPISVAPDDDGWILTTRDITGMGTQNLGCNQMAFHFVFFPDDVTITPGTPSQDWADRINDVCAARFEVTEIRPDNNNGDMRTEISYGSDALSVSGDNRGDIGLAWLDARPASFQDNGLDDYEGFWIGNPTEFIRDNSGTGGVSGWSTVSFDNAFVRTHNASEAGGEINSDFAMAFFPAGAGFEYDGDVQVTSGESYDTVTIDGNAEEDGVLLAINWDNNNRVVSVSPSGSDCLIECWDADTGSPSTDWDYGYIYLPYDTPNLIAGQIDDSGNVLSSTGDFTVGTGIDSVYGFYVTTITIPDVDAATDGVLVVTAADGPYAMAWEAGANGEFEVAGLELTEGNPGQTGFLFAYIPYDFILDPCPDCVGDLNGDCEVNLTDLATLLGSYGMTEGAAEEDGDLDDDGDVDLSDLAMLLGHYGEICE